MPIITVSRELGSFGTQIAEEVAARFNTVCVDKQVLAEMARQADVSVEVIVEAEEQLLSRPMVVSEEMRALFSGQHKRTGGLLTEGNYVEQMGGAIRALAEQGNVVFLGRGSQLILAQHPGCLHVHLYAPPEVRAARIQARRKLTDPAVGARIVRQFDEQRREWFKRFFKGANWKDARHYHLMIDTARIPAELAVDLIAAAAASSPSAG